MTTYRHTVTFNDSEISMINNALELLIEYTDEVLKDGIKAPYFALNTTAKEVKEKLYLNSTMMSTNNFSDFNSKHHTIEWIKAKLKRLNGS